jgi:hypothetical protein
VRYVAAVLLIGVFMRHNSAYWLSAATGHTPQGIFLIMGGLWEILLCGVLLPIVWATEKSVWREFALAALAICVIEALQVSTCRALIIDQRVVPAGVPLCDYLVGLPFGRAIPIGEAIMATYTFVLCFIAVKEIRCRMIQKR